MQKNKSVHRYREPTANQDDAHQKSRKETMTDHHNTPPNIKEVQEVLRGLERDGFLESKLCADGQIRWYSTGKPYYKYAWDGADTAYRLN
jgi:hypothetical protein